MFIHLVIYQGEGNGTPLQYSCLENPMDGGAWWAAVYGVSQSQRRLKRLSSSSSSHYHVFESCSEPGPAELTLGDPAQTSPGPRRPS